MANTRKFRYEVGFDIDKKSADMLEKELNKLINIRPSDLAKINGGIADNYKEEAKKINNYAHEIKMAMESAYNPKLKTTNIEVFNKILKQSGINLKEISQIFANSGTAGTNTINLLTNSMTKFNVKIKESHKILNSLGRTLTNTLKWNLSATLINKVSGSIQQAWGFSKNLQESLTNIRIVTGKSADEMRKFAQEANKAAAQLGRTTTDYTKASLIYAQQGLNDAEIKKRSEITLKTANVTGQSADKVSEELTAVWNGYKVTAEEAEIYIDRLAAVASKTASNLQELSTGMSKVAAAAASLGVGEDQLAAQLATIISVTRQAPETVGTALKTIYSRITDIKAGIDEDGTTLGTYSKKLSTMGINVLDATGNLRNMGQVMEEIGSKWGSFSKQQQVYIAQTMAGQRQYTNLIALFDNYQDKYVSALNTARNASGTLNKQNSIYLEDINTKITQLTASTEKLWMNLIDTDSFKGIIEGLTTIIQKVDVLFQSLGGGRTILNSVGSIAMRIMSRSSATEINTFLNNREQGIAQKKAVKQQIQKAQKSYDAMVDKNSPQAMALREKLQYLPNMAYFSKDQYTEINKLFDEMTLAGVNSKNAEDQKKFYDSLIKKFGNINQEDFSKISSYDAVDKMVSMFGDDADKFQQLRGEFLYASDDFLNEQKQRQDKRDQEIKNAKNKSSQARKDLTQKEQAYNRAKRAQNTAQQSLDKKDDELKQEEAKKVEFINTKIEEGNRKRAQQEALQNLLEEDNIAGRKQFTEDNKKRKPEKVQELESNIKKLQDKQKKAQIDVSVDEKENMTNDRLKDINTRLKEIENSKKLAENDKNDQIKKLEQEEKNLNTKKESLEEALDNKKKSLTTIKKLQENINSENNEKNAVELILDEKVDELKTVQGELKNLKSLRGRKRKTQKEKDLEQRERSLEKDINRLTDKQRRAQLNIEIYESNIKENGNEEDISKEVKKKNGELNGINTRLKEIENSKKLAENNKNDQIKKLEQEEKNLNTEAAKIEKLQEEKDDINKMKNLSENMKTNLDNEVQNWINSDLENVNAQINALPSNEKIEEEAKNQFDNKIETIQAEKETLKNERDKAEEKARQAEKQLEKAKEEKEKAEKEFDNISNQPVQVSQKDLEARKSRIQGGLKNPLVTKYMNVEAKEGTVLRTAQKTKEEIEKLIENLDDADEDKLAEIEEKYAKFFEFLRDNAQQLEAEFQNSYIETLDQMESQAKRQQEILQQIYDLASSSMREAIIDGTIQLVGAVGQLQSSLQGLANIGNIWEDENVSFGEKLLKTFYNLIVTVPLLINGMTSVRSNLQKTRDNIIGFRNKRQETKNRIDEVNERQENIQNEKQRLLKQKQEQEEQNNKKDEQTQEKEQKEQKKKDEQTQTQEKEKKEQQKAAELTKETEKQAANEEKKTKEIEKQAAKEEKKTKETEKQAANEEKKTEETEKQAANEEKEPEETEEDENDEEDDLDEVTGGATGKAKKIAEKLKEMGSELGDTLTEQLPSKGFNIATGVGGAIAGAGMVAMQMWQENINNTSQNIIEENNKIIESESQLQQKMTNAANSIHELNEQYKQGILTRQETKNALFELAKQYDTEINIVDELANSYNNLAKALQNVERREKIKQVNSMDRQINAEKGNLKQSMRHAHYGNQASYMLSSAWADKMETLHLGMNGEWTTDSSRQALDFINFMESRGHKQSAFSMPGDQLWQIETEEQAYKFYKDAAQFNKKYGNTSGFNNSIQEMLEQNSDTIKKVDEEKYQNAINKASIGANDAKKFLNATNNYNDFVKGKQDIENAIRDSIVGTYEEATPEEIENMVQIIMATTFQGSQIYAKYNRTAEVEKILNSHFGEASLTSHAHDLLLGMSSQQLAAIENLNFDYIDNMVQLESIFEKIANNDYSAVEDFSNISFKKLADENQIWNQLYSKVASGQIISYADYQTYKQSNLFVDSAEFQRWWDQHFIQNSNGNYIIKNQDETEQDILLKSGARTEQKTWQQIEQAEDKKRWDKNNPNPFLIKQTQLDKKDLDTDDLSNLIKRFEGISVNTLGIQGKRQLQEASALINSGEFIDYYTLDKYYTRLGTLYQEINRALLYQKVLPEEEEKNSLENLYWTNLRGYDTDIDLTLMNNLSKQFQDTAESSNLLNDSLKINEQLALRVSHSVLRYNSALQNIVQNIANWKTQLTSGSELDKTNLIPTLKNVYADILDLNEASLSKDFLLDFQNLNLLQQAATGVNGAYDKLMEKAQQSILINVKTQIDTNDYDKLFNNWKDFNTQVQKSDIALKQTGTEITEGNIVTSANELYKTFNDLNIDISILNSLLTTSGLEMRYLADGSISLVVATKEAVKTSNLLSSTAKSLAQKQADRLAAHQKLDKYLEDERDLYHDINREISSIDRNLSRIKTKQQNLTGIELYNNLNKQNAELKTKGKKLEQKNKLQQQDLINSRNKLGKYGVTFNENGQISNYMSVLAGYENQINNVIKRKNQIKNSMEAWTAADGDRDSDYYINLQNELRKADEQYDEINDKYSMLKTSISKYDSLLDQHENTIDTQSEILRQQIQNNIQKFNLKVSVQLDLSNAEKEWEDFKKNVLNRDDLLNPSNTITLKQKDVSEATVNYQNRMKDSQAISSSLLQVFTEINNFNKAKENGTIYQSNLFNSVSEAYTKLQELQTQGKEALKDAAEYADIIKQAYLDAFTYIQEEFDKQDKYYNFISEQLKHDISLIDLIYGSRGGEYKDNYYNQMNDFEMDRLDMLKKQQDFWAKQEATAISEASKKIAHENWKTVTNNLNSVTESVIQNLKTKFQNMIDTIVNKLENSLTDGHGFDYITMEWDILKKHADMYLDTVNSAFAIKNTEYLFNQAINDTTGLKNQQNLKKVMEEQMNILKEKDKLTKYDVDRAEKVLEIEKARIALEEARNNKTTMRLKRDSSGNYSYQFTVDEDAVDKAQNDLYKAQNDLYNFDLQAWHSNNEKAVAIFKDAINQIAEIRKNDNLSEQQKQERIALIQKDTQEKMTFYAQENNFIRTNLEQSTYDSMIDLMNSSEINYRDMIQGMNSESQNFIDKFNSNPDSVMNMFNEAIQNMEDKSEEYNIQIENVVKTAKGNFEELKEATDPIVENEAAMVTKNDELIDSMDKTISKVSGWVGSLSIIESNWQGVYDQTENALTKAQEYVRYWNEHFLGKTQDETKNNGGSNQGGGKKGGNGNYINPGEKGMEGLFAKLSTITTSNPPPSKTSIPDGEGKKEQTQPQKKGQTQPQLDADTIADKTAARTAASKQKDREEAKAANYARREKLLKDLNNIPGYKWSSDFYRTRWFDNAKGKPKITPENQYGWSKDELQRLKNMIVATYRFKTIVKNQKDFTLKGPMAYQLQDYINKYNNQNDSPEDFFWNAINNTERMNMQGMITGAIDEKQINDIDKIIKEQKMFDFDNFDKVIRAATYDTGGYTGNWNSSDGRFAVLHEKELVLNKNDTANMLKIVQASRNIIDMVQNNVLSVLSSQIQQLNSTWDSTKAQVNKYNQETVNNRLDTQKLNQQVSIEANFPNVTNKTEIQEAFSDLVNLATQKALNYNKN